MREIPTQQNKERDYSDGYAQVMWFAERGRTRGWRLTDRQLLHAILQRERAAEIREKSSLPLLGEVRSAAWNRGQADALRVILREQHEVL